MILLSNLVFPNVVLDALRIGLAADPLLSSHPLLPLPSFPSTCRSMVNKVARTHCYVQHLLSDEVNIVRVKHGLSPAQDLFSLAGYSSSSTGYVPPQNIRLGRSYCRGYGGVAICSAERYRSFTSVKPLANLQQPGLEASLA